jgi:LCP family protein required for cell wall assembly
LEPTRGERPAAAPRSSATAAFLSFLWPGLGHWYVGRRRGAVLFAAPAILAVLALASQAAGGLEQLVGLLLVPTSALTVMILVILLGVWRLIALVDAAAAPRDTRRRSAAVAVGLALVVVATHAWAGYVAWAFYDNGSDVYVGENGPDRTQPPAASLDPAATTPPDVAYEATPLATPETDEARINVLLTGVDSAASRSTELTDTIMIASIDPETSDVVLISFPRDISNFPLWDGRTYRGKINSFMSWARSHPDEFPDGPLQSLVREIGFLLGAPIHYYAAIDLAGFRQMIDAVGGVEVEVEKALNDARYDWLDGRRGFRLSAGTHTLDGETALAYVRSRYSPGDNDFNRARRQQQVLLSLRRALTDVSMLPRIPELVDIGGDTIRTNFPSDRVSEMLALASEVDEDSVRQYVLGPPYAFNPVSTDGIYRLQLDMERLAKLSIDVFGDDSAYAVNDPGASPAPSGP